MTTTPLSSKRITIEAPVAYVRPLHVFDSLRGVVQSLSPTDVLHMTLLHVGRIPELIDEIELFAGTVDRFDDIASELGHWLSNLHLPKEFVALASTVTTFGPQGAEVAALEVYPD